MYDHILIPVAPGHADEYADALAMADRLLSDGGKVTVLAVVEAVPTYVDAYIPTDYLDRNINQTRDEMQKTFGDGANVQVVPGHPANAILDWARDNGAACIVVSSHRPGLSDYFLGSTAARIVRHAHCPVVVLR